MHRITVTEGDDGRGYATKDGHTLWGPFDTSAAAVQAVNRAADMVALDLAGLSGYSPDEVSTDECAVR